MKAHEKYYLQACKAFGKTPVPVLEDRTDSDVVSSDAYSRLITCIAFKNVINGKRWIPVYDGLEDHYYAYFRPNASGSGFSCTSTGNWDTDSIVGARLEYRTRKLCEQGVKEFEVYYIDFMLLKKDETENN